MDDLLYSITRTLANFDYNTLIKLCLACFLGSLIGLEREKKRKPVGIKTCMIISVTTCLLTIVSIQAAEYYAALSDNIRTDPMRLAAQVISGIGFIGTGVIMHRTNDVVSGITTAAMIWAAAAVGISIGAGFYQAVIIVTVAMFFILKYSSMITRHIRKQDKIERLRVQLELKDLDHLQPILDTLDANDCTVSSLNIKEREQDNILSITINAKTPEENSSYHIYRDLKVLEGLHNIEVKYVMD
ncbi:MgtC/SapB family protein [Bibersteinia trehalosi]|nr:MgtC/SapB family protein [Bibersteinia trehalosi]OAQ13948.1 membrane protein [Bibersteinia trehalosi Y31]RRN05356.1 MgtC/SapB family protein [Bibersteinia trehalosi]TCT16493.1 putative Mg2+ transporter-C (MgtC) family protein [Bibersteinia trehalosi]